MIAKVRLYCEQEAWVQVEVPGDTLPPVRELQQLALEKLDESGGAEWVTLAAYADYAEVCNESSTASHL